jgi:hypothetical protein
MTIRGKQPILGALCLQRPILGFFHRPRLATTLENKGCSLGDLYCKTDYGRRITSPNMAATPTKSTNSVTPTPRPQFT